MEKDQGDGNIDGAANHSVWTMQAASADLRDQGVKTDLHI
jgi:hypothetical protein